MEKYGVTLNPTNEILPLLGSKEGVMHISMAFLNPGDQVLVPNPGYPTYNSVTRLVEAEPVFYNLDEKSFESEISSNNASINNNELVLNKGEIELENSIFKINLPFYINDSKIPNFIKCSIPTNYTENLSLSSMAII